MKACGPIRHFSVLHSSAASEVRRVATAMAADLGFDATQQAEAAIVVTEAAKNLALHGRGGEVLLRPLVLDGTRAIEMLAIDHGPGMADLARCLRDGYSTAGTAGTGLGAMERLSARFEVYSTADKGTVIQCLLGGEGSPTDRALEVGVVSVEKPGQTVCGDGWGFAARPEGWTAMVVDGLGHGLLAREASAEAERIFLAHHERPPEELIERMHQALRSTRGAAAAVAACDPRQSKLTFAGIGNISGLTVVGGEVKNTVSQNGTLGHQLRKIRGFDYPFPPGATLLLHSDGLTNRLQLESYPGLLNRPAGLIAGVLYRDHSRGSDDTTILVARLLAASDPKEAGS